MIHSQQPNPTQQQTSGEEVFQQNVVCSTPDPPDCDVADSHLVNDVDKAIDCRQVGGEDGRVSNADHLKQKNNTLSD